MIPAMYFLAVQIVNRRVALIAATVHRVAARTCSSIRAMPRCTCTCGSSARSASACLLWWLRVRTRIAWLCWVAASVAMCGIHAPGAVLLAIELLIFLSYDRRWWIPGCILLARIRRFRIVPRADASVLAGHR